MMPCVYNENDKCKLYSDEKHTSWCLNGPCADQRLSNGDRIRAMSVEELAKFLDDCNSHGCVCPARDCRATCHECIEDWLKQPAEVE